MLAPFVIFSLPRSRSTWLSVFLGRPEAPCGHDIAMSCTSPADFPARLRVELVGTCETGVAFAHRLIRRQMPDARFVVIERDPIEVCASLARFGIAGLEIEAEIWARARALDEICADPRTMSYHFNDLKRSDVCADLYQQCLGRPMPPAWWRSLEAVNIQVDMRRNLETLKARAAPIAALKEQAREMLGYV
jgi:hypothetical protein